MIGELDHGCGEGGDRLQIRCPEHSCDTSRRGRRAIKFVQARNRIAEMLGGEHLYAPAKPLTVVFGNEDVVDLDGSERFERFLFQTRHAYPFAPERQRLTESA